MRSSQSLVVLSMRLAAMVTHRPPAIKAAIAYARRPSQIERWF
jgi:hypothetical protein